VTPEQRTAVYALAAFTSPLLVAYGVASETNAALWLAWVEAALAAVVAFWNRPTKVDPLPPLR
jgi:hypothetical protein